MINQTGPVYPMRLKYQGQLYKMQETIKTGEAFVAVKHAIEVVPIKVDKVKTDTVLECNHEILPCMYLGDNIDRICCKCNQWFTPGLGTKTMGHDRPKNIGSLLDNRE